MEEGVWYFIQGSNIFILDLRSDCLSVLAMFFNSKKGYLSNHVAIV
jgi:hypothetical protein